LEACRKKQRPAAGSQDLYHLMHHALSHGQRAPAHVDRQKQFALWGHRHPPPVRRARQKLERLGLADLARLDCPEQGIEFIELHLCDAYVVQEIPGKGGGVIRNFDQPLQHRIGIDLEHAGTRAAAKADSYRPDSPRKHLGRYTVAMNRGAMAFLKISAAGYTLELPPRVAARMTVGTEVAAPHPAVIRTIRVGTEMMRHVDRAP